MFKPEDYLDFTQTEHSALFADAEYVWDALRQIPLYLQSRLQPAMLGRVSGQPFIGDRVFIGEGTVIEPGAYIAGPAWIGRNCHVRHGAYLRENVIVSDGCVLGNSCEFKNCVLFNEAQVPHFSYVGDSILGHRAHLGAGVILSNLRLDRREIVVRQGERRIATGLRKFGAIVGDEAEVGCNAVINPGSLLGRRSAVYPALSWHGVLAADGVASGATV
ncbi:MAG: UDP-N-acetylglucosamine diphosphorylase [Verrucomicrobiales bacterium]|jgi:NDP-sugar pyrophosphorylase family protein|nr:UDP-N-acetylglucosamine diphosphorylase [Verrucomicrobiales bacterium]